VPICLSLPPWWGTRVSGNDISLLLDGKNFVVDEESVEIS